MTSSEIKTAMDAGNIVTARTRHGSWREIVALYSDNETVGTIHASGTVAGFVWIQDISAFREFGIAQALL